MTFLEFLKSRKSDYELMSDVPIEDVVEWYGLINLLSGAIEEIEKQQKENEQLQTDLEFTKMAYEMCRERNLEYEGKLNDN